MSLAVGQIVHLTPPQVQVAICMLIDAFKYSRSKGARLHGPRAGNPTTRAIIHRGIDGHLQSSSGHTAARSETITSVSRLGARSTQPPLTDRPHERTKQDRNDWARSHGHSAGGASGRCRL
ncbi:MAG: hypothetical protein J2P50_01610 [Hyphomicrobiaceae bacterium]|nr:hypothetical protein [Hyphomicrobiaceae bacterium]